MWGKGGGLHLVCSDDLKRYDPHRCAAKNMPVIAGQASKAHSTWSDDNIPNRERDLAQGCAPGEGAISKPGEVAASVLSLKDVQP